MRRRVGQPVGRHEAVQATATNPVIDVPTLCRQIDVLDACARGDEVPVRRPAAITAVMEPVGLDIRWELALDLPRARIAPREDAGIGTVGHGSRPHQTVDDQHVVGRSMTAAMMRRRPENPAIARRQGCHRFVLDREQDHVLVNDERRPIPGRKRRLARHRLGSPQRLAAGAIHRRDSLSVIVVHPLAVHAQGERSHACLSFPERLAAVGRHGHQPAVGLVPGPLAIRAPCVVPHVGVLGPVVLPFVGLARRQHKQGAAVGQDLVGELRVGTRQERLAAGPVQHFHGTIDVQGHVNPLPHRHQSPGKLVRSALQRPQMRVPLSNRPLPEKCAIEGIACHQRPLRQQEDGLARAFVHDVEHPPLGRDHRAEAGHVVVMPRPRRPAGPLQVPRRTDQLVVRHGVVARVVQIVRPLVHLLGTRLARHEPLAVLPYAGHALRRQHTHDLILRGKAHILDHQQIDQVVDIRQLRAGASVDRHNAIQAQRSHMVPRDCHVLRLPVQTLDEEGIACTQGGG